MQNTGRILYFDQIRALAILMVIIGHVLPWSFGVEHSLLLTLVTTIELPVFFYISGYFSTAKKTQINLWEGANIITKSFVRYLVPMFAVGFLSEILTDYPFMDSVLHRDGGRYWFLYALFYVGFMSTMMHGLSSFLKIRSLFLDIILFGAAYMPFFVMKMFGISLPEIIPMGAILTYYPFYVVGVLAGKYQKVNNLIMESKVLYVLSICVLVFGIWFLTKQTNALVSLLTAACSIVLMFQIFSNLPQQGVALTYLSKIGKSTLAIYLFHYFFIFDMKWMEPYLTTNGSFMLQLIVGVTSAVVIVCICLAIEWILGRTKLTRNLFLGK